MKLELPEIYVGMRIDKALSEHFGLSRNFFHNLFERGLITRLLRREGIHSTLLHDNEKVVVKKSYTIEGGDCFLLPELERYADNQIMHESPKIELEIKHQTSDYLVLYKPKGVLSHPKTLFDVKEPSVSGFLFHTFGHLPGVSGFIRGGIVHRLDKDTDGLMIIALSERGLKYFRELFDKKGDLKEFENIGDKLRKTEKNGEKLRKHYRALCEITKKGQKRLEMYGFHVSSISISNHNIGDGNKGIILDSLIYPKTNIVGYPKRGVTMVRGVHVDRVESLDSAKSSGYLGSTQDDIIKGGQIVVELEIITGRTHQIRYQLAEIGLPIIGDGLYGSGYGTLGLTAYKLKFIDPDGKEVVVMI